MFFWNKKKRGRNVWDLIIIYIPVDKEGELLWLARIARRGDTLDTQIILQIISIKYIKGLER